MTTLISPARPVTAEELERISGHYELIQGELREMSPSGGQHGLFSGHVFGRVYMHVESHTLGKCFSSECGFLLSSNPDTVLAPDMAFIQTSRLPRPMPAGFVPLAPDLVLETRSPGDTRREVASKVRRWLEFGVSVVWSVDPSDETLTVHRLEATPEVLRLGDTLEEPRLLPGFALPIEVIFR